jgi:integrase
MRGTIVKKPNGRYYVATHHLDENGKRQQRWHGGYRTRKEAERVLTEVLTQLNEGTFVVPSKQTLAHFLRVEWLPTILVGGLRPSTFASYQTIVEKHIIPRLGNHRLQALTPAMLNAFYAELRDNGLIFRDGGLSPKSVRYTYMILRKALADAHRWGYVPRNVASLSNPPRSSYRKAMRTWSPSEVRRFLTVARGDRLYPLWLLAASTGMRRGELLGLPWSNVDLPSRRLYVAQSWISVGYVAQMSEPKTARGRRVIPVDATTIAALHEWRLRQAEEFSGTPLITAPAEFVFTTLAGTLLHPQSISDRFSRIVAEAGLPRIRFHDLRHTFATNALRAGIPPKVVSEILGHTSVSFTLDVYTHAIPAMQADAVDQVADLIWGANGNPGPGHPDDMPQNDQHEVDGKRSDTGEPGRPDDELDH